MGKTIQPRGTKALNHACSSNNFNNNNFMRYLTYTFYRKGIKLITLELTKEQAEAYAKFHNCSFKEIHGK